MLVLCAWLLLDAVGGTLPSSQEILTRVANTTVRRHAVTWSGMRQYTLQNLRFSKQAAVTVKVTHRPGEGKQFTIVERSGTDRLIGVVEKLIALEAESSRQGQHVIGPTNYDARVRGGETMAGRDCYVLDLTPKAKSKYLFDGKIWVDKSTYGIVRLDGTTAANISMWIGAPHVIEDFTQISGIWLPAHTQSVSSTMLLGESRFEIRYMDYQVRP
jgi:hypothetical protein